jgi:hypothetical protein
LFSFKATFDFDAENDDELSIKEGDVITIESEAEGWMLGVNQRGQQVSVAIVIFYGGSYFFGRDCSQPIM